MSDKDGSAKANARAKTSVASAPTADAAVSVPSAAAAGIGGVPARGWLFMGLLACQFGLQPLVTKRHVSAGADKVPLVLLCEILKCAVASLLLVTEGGLAGRAALASWTLRESLAGGAVPAAIYAVQNVCIQVGYQHTSGLLFNLLNQTKIIFTAVMVYLFMGKRQSGPQLVALLLVLVVGVVLSLPPTSSVSSSESAGFGKFDFWQGIVPTILAALLSGVASGWSQRVMQGKAQRHAYLFSAELSLFSALFLLGKMITASTTGGTVNRLAALLRENPMAWVPVTTNAIGGIFVGQVIKYAGGVRKSFAVIAGIVLTGVAEWLFLGEQLSPRIGLCLPIIVVAMVVYATHPYKVASAGPKMGEKQD